MVKLERPKCFNRYKPFLHTPSTIDDKFIVEAFVDKETKGLHFGECCKYYEKEEICKYLENRFKDESYSWNELVYRVEYGIETRPVCKTCGKPLKMFYSRDGGMYLNFCSNKCVGDNPEIQEQKRKHCKEHYGVDYPMQSQVVRQKSEEKCLEVYGVRIISQSPEIQQRFKDNYKERTGYDNPMQNPEVLAKFNWDEMVKHQHETKRKTGNWGSQVSESELRIKEVLINKYGDIDVKDQYSDVRYLFNCDFYIPSLDLFIEYNGHPSHGDKPYNNTVEDNELISIWESNKSKRIQKYQHVFCHTDIGKLEIAKANKIKLVVFNTVAEAVYCINNNIYDVVYNKYEYSTNKLEEFIEENLHKEKVNFSDKKFIQKYTTIVNTKFGLPFGVYDFSNDKSFNKVKLENQESVD